MIHFDIKPFDTYVRQEFIYDFKVGFDKFLDCKVFSVSSYPGHVPTFNILIEDKYIYSYLPINAFTNSPHNNVKPIPIDSSYFNCPSHTLSVNVFDHLLNKRCHIYHRDGKWCGDGKYRMTFDWFNDNELCHLIEKSDGYFMLWPSHKLIFSDSIEDKLPKFKKSHHEWKLPIKV